MASTSRSDELPEGFKSWRDFNKAKKEKRQLKQEYQIKKLEKLKQKELETAASNQAVPNIKKVCDEPSTLSIAVPGSILDNAQSAELRTYLAGQIARAACVFKVDEIVVYDDVGIQDNVTAKTVQSLSDSGEVCPARRCCAQLARILQFLECPQYLRKEFFPKHKDLEYAGLLNPLDAPHHMRQQDDGKFREGVVLPQPAKSGSYVNVGLLKHVKVNLPLQPGIRVTVEMLPSPFEAKRLLGKVVPPSRPQRETGIYWGYSVRLANSINTIFTECPYKEGYDVTIGTSERGDPVETVSFPSHRHVLVVFGGLSGIEAALEADDVLTVDNPALLFDHYVNTCPDQGSRTIRTEEAILITLAELRTKLKPKVPIWSQQKETESDNDLAAEVSDTEFDSDGNIDEDGDSSAPDDSTQTEEAKRSSNITSKSYNDSTEIQESKKRRSFQDSPQLEDLMKKPSRKETLNSELGASTESMELVAKISTKSKKKKRHDESFHDETLHSEMNTLVDLAENGSVSSKNTKKKRRKTEN